MLHCDDLAIIEQTAGLVASNSASAGYIYGRTSNSSGGPTNAVTSGDWLKTPSQNFSNISGLTFGLSNGKILGIFANTRDLDTYDFTIFQHDGDEVNLTALVTLSVVATRMKVFTLADIQAANGGSDVLIGSPKQLAVRITDGSAQSASIQILPGGTL